MTWLRRLRCALTSHHNATIETIEPPRLRTWCTRCGLVLLDR